MTTESNNPRTRGIGERRIDEIVEIINSEDFQAFTAVKNALSEVSKAAEICLSSVKNGGRVIYVGAGTSGRIAVQDIVELDPTYGIDDRTFLYIMAGGVDALTRSREGSEDDTGAAEENIRRISAGPKDTIVGISASGRTPFVLAAIREGKKRGSFTIGIVNNPHSPIGNESDLCVFLDTGPEVIQGSTRMKAGTSQKLVLNTISTTVAIKMGRVYDNMMSHMGVTFNSKLKERAVNFLSQEFGISRESAMEYLRSNDYKLWAAIEKIRMERGYINRKDD